MQDGDGAGEPDDAFLVRAARTQPDAFAPLYDRYRDRVLAYCYHRLGDVDDAEDAASAIFLKVVQALPTFHDQAGLFRSWLFRIAHNEVADWHKRRARRPQSPLEAAHHVKDPARSPEDLALQADAHRRLHHLLRELPARERHVLELRAVGLGTEEIAHALAITPPLVRTVQHRALSRLRGAMADAELRVETRRNDDERSD